MNRESVKEWWSHIKYMWNEKKRLREMVTLYEKDLSSNAEEIAELTKTIGGLRKQLNSHGVALIDAAKNVEDERKSYEEQIQSLQIRNSFLEARVKKLTDRD